MRRAPHKSVKALFLAVLACWASTCEQSIPAGPTPGSCPGSPRNQQQAWLWRPCVFLQQPSVFCCQPYRSQEAVAVVVLVTGSWSLNAAMAHGHVGFLIHQPQMHPLGSSPIRPILGCCSGSHSSPRSQLFQWFFRYLMPDGKYLCLAQL